MNVGELINKLGEYDDKDDVLIEMPIEDDLEGFVEISTIEADGIANVIIKLEAS